MRKKTSENVAIINIIARTYETSQHNLTATLKTDKVRFYFLLSEPLNKSSRGGIMLIYLGFIAVRHPDCALHTDTLTSAIDFLCPGN